MKICVWAFAALSNSDSENTVGWNWVNQIARFHEVWVFTKETAKIESLSNIHWIKVIPPFSSCFRSNTATYYLLWQIKAYFMSKKINKEVKFDIAHHITLISWSVPSLLSLLPVNFVWGPVGGSDILPIRFFKTLSLHGKIYELKRNIYKWLLQKNPLLKVTAKKTKVALAVGEKTKKSLVRLGIKNISILPSPALTSSDLSNINFTIKVNRNTNIFKIVSIGRLMPSKCFNLGILAFNNFQKMLPNSEYHIIGGDRGEKKRLEKLVHRLNIENKVFFLGHLSRNEIFTKMAEYDLFIHPSLREGASYVIIEAIAAGKPVICFDLDGATTQVTDETGIRIPVKTPEHAIKALEDAMVKLANNPDLREEMGKAGRKRVIENFNLDKQGEYLNEIYANLVF